MAADTGYWRGKTVLITGGSGGMGRAIASRFAAAGASLAFDAATIGELVQLVEEQVDRLRAEVPAAT